MSDIMITLALPEKLVEQAESAGLTLDKTNLTALIEAEIARKQSVKNLRELTNRLRGSLTEAEIEEELAIAKEERIAQAKT